MNKNLKPCPFCGCPPHMNKHKIFCDCGAEFEFPTNEWGCSDESPESFPTYEQAKEVAVERWNSREELSTAAMAQRRLISQKFVVRHGHWYKPTGMMPTKFHGRKRCSECGDFAPYYEIGRETLSKFCPECGAKMDGEIDENY